MPKRALILDRGMRDRSFALDPNAYAVRALVQRYTEKDLVGVNGITPELIRALGFVVKHWPPVDSDDRSSGAP